MICPWCGSENYSFVDVADYDISYTSLHFKCLGKCGKDFYGMYSFMYFEDEEGNEIESE